MESPNEGGFGHEDSQKLKTKVRRLYDIANVLQSIGLIEKTNSTVNKKPAFRWIGIHGVHDFVKELSEERKASGNHIEQGQSNHEMVVLNNESKSISKKSLET